jgi:hypothetical protein
MKFAQINGDQKIIERKSAKQFSAASVTPFCVHFMHTEHETEQKLVQIKSTILKLCSQCSSATPNDEQ